MIKYETTPQDKEDHEQEKAIMQWMQSVNGDSRSIVFRNTTRNGNIKSFNELGSFSLDEDIVKGEASGTYHDIIGGPERDFGGYGFYCSEFEEEQIQIVENERIKTNSYIEQFLMYLGLKGEIFKWATKNYKHKLSNNKFNL